MSIRGTYDRGLEQSVVTIYCHQGLNDEGHEAQILFGGLAWSMEQGTVVGGKTPVVMFSRTVDAVEGFLVKQHTEAMIAGHTFHQRHQEHVMVNGEVTLLEDRSKLELIGGNLVVTGLTGDGELESLDLKIFHEGLYTIGDSTEVVVVHLLVLGTLVSHECATCKHKVGTCGIESLVDEEILLFPSEINLYLMYVIIEILAHIGSGLVNGMQGS